jgi:hypothetical protein
MMRACLWVLVLTMAIVPAANGVCGLGCDLDRTSASATARPAAADQECPLHHQANRSQPPVPRTPAGRCGHDHTMGGPGLLRTSSDAPRPADTLATLAPHVNAAPVPAPAVPVSIALRHAPSSSPPHRFVLRI